MLFNNLPRVSVQRLFGAALTLKVVLSFIGWLVNDPWILGFAIPIFIMIGYMVIGYHAREDDVSSEKFADSCYYIGFIFTMTSIILSLFDLPNLGSGDSLRNIAIRFATAMVSTVLGMGVRVYLVSFRKDAADAVQDAEEAVLDATRMLVSQLNAVVDELKQFQLQVLDTSKVTAENVNRQISELGQNYAKSLSGFYGQVIEENRGTFIELLEEVRGATSQVAESVNTYSSGMAGHLKSIEHKVTDFADAVSSRLANTTFPDDYFDRHLQAPLDQLKAESSKLGDNVHTVAGLVQESSTSLAAVLKQIKTKTRKTEDAMDAMVQLSEQHRALLHNADVQLKTLIMLTEHLEKIDSALKGTLRTVDTNSNASAELLTKVAFLGTEILTLRSEIKGTIAALTKPDAVDNHCVNGSQASTSTGGLAAFEYHAERSEKGEAPTGPAARLLQGTAELQEGGVSISHDDANGGLHHNSLDASRPGQISIMPLLPADDSGTKITGHEMQIEIPHQVHSPEPVVNSIELDRNSAVSSDIPPSV